MRNYCCLFFVLSLPADSFGKEKKAKEVVGTLRGSVTFQLNMSEKFTTISWLRLTPGIKHIAVVEAAEPCLVKVFFPKLKGRLNVSRDCRDLQITDLHQDDSGGYRAQIEEHEEEFSLKIYKNLSESDLEVRCENDSLGDGNYTLLLNCSAGKWEDGVNYSWTSTSKDGKIPSQVVQSHFQDGDANYTCTAENPVSRASKTVSIKEACKAHPTAGPGTVATTGTGNTSEGLSSHKKLIPVWIILGIVVIAAAIVIGYVLWKKQKRAACSMPPDPTGSTVPDESGRTIYAQIDCLPSEQTDTKKTQPQQKRPKAQDGPHTIYASVGQPKPADDPSIKTVYDTVNAPRRPEGSEFRKLL